MPSVCAQDTVQQLVINLLFSSQLHHLAAMKQGYSFVRRMKCSYFSKISLTGNQTHMGEVSLLHNLPLCQSQREVLFEGTKLNRPVRWAGNNSSSTEQKDILFLLHIWTVRITLVCFYVPTGDFRNLIAVFHYLKRAWKKSGDGIFVGLVATGQEVMVLN